MLVFNSLARPKTVTVENTSHNSSYILNRFNTRSFPLVLRLFSQEVGFTPP